MNSKDVKVGQVVRMKQHTKEYEIVTDKTYEADLDAPEDKIRFSTVHEDHDYFELVSTKEVAIPDKPIKIEAQFKVLMFCNQFFVDLGLLSNGIYSTNTPVLLSMETEIEDKIKLNQGFVGRPYMMNQEQHDAYAENMRKCELKVVKLTI